MEQATLIFVILMFDFFLSLFLAKTLFWGNQFEMVGSECKG